MKTIIRLLGMLLKKQCRKPLYVLFLFFLPCISFWIHGQIRHIADRPVTVLLATDSKESFTTDIISDLTGYEGNVFFRQVPPEEMIPLLEQGGADCGYYFTDLFLQKLLTGKQTDSVILYLPEQAELYPFLNEIVHAAIYHRMAPYYAEQFLKDSGQYEDLLSLAEEEIFTHFRQIGSHYDSQKLQVKTVRGTTMEKDASNALFPIYNICGLLLSGIVFFAAASYQKEKEQGILKAMPSVLQNALLPCELFAAYFPAMLSCLLTVLLCGAGNLWNVLIAFLLYFPLLLCFSFAVLIVTGSYRTCLSFLPFYLLAEIIFAPVFLNLASVFPVVRVLEKLFPVTYFLNF